MLMYMPLLSPFQVRAQVVKDAIAKLLEEALAGKGPLAGPLGTAASGPSPQDVEPTANTAGRAILITAADPPVPEAIPAAFDTDEASIQSLTVGYKTTLSLSLINRMYGSPLPPASHNQPFIFSMPPSDGKHRQPRIH